ncbi:Uncharacterised protein [Legionella cincinnatiensis]|uniref:Uncharacterized protein n=1 Tax=Legionella cincinnatiensis TaxID=28085 RepID=A0A378IJ96_9GAMM|nr:Uncharacterised protein [Legionella cincinnatiensis]
MRWRPGMTKMPDHQALFSTISITLFPQVFIAFIKV